MSNFKLTQQKNCHDPHSGSGMNTRSRAEEDNTRVDMSDHADNLAENPQDNPGKVNVTDNGDTDDSVFPVGLKSKRGWGRTYGY